MKFPFSQGPLVRPLDWYLDKVSEKEASENKTLFKHEDGQECFEWIPKVTGLNAWNDNTQMYDLQNPAYSVQGPISTKSMGIVYGCNKGKCLVHCPCTVCCDDKKSCKLSCRDQICEECNSQCLNHQIKLARLFDPETDSYTLVNNKKNNHDYAIPYAGIPVSCSLCQNDLREHQIFHLVFHTRCRYCRDLLRPFEVTVIESLEDYEEAEKWLKIKDDKTCSYCANISSKKEHRVSHEATIHEKGGKYGC